MDIIKADRNVSFFYARHKHRIWVIKLQAFILGLTDIEEKEILSDKDCELHTWIEKFAKPEYGENSLIKELIDTHKKVHSLYFKVFSSINNNDKHVAKANFELLNNYSDQILLLMDKLKPY